MANKLNQIDREIARVRKAVEFAEHTIDKIKLKRTDEFDRLKVLIEEQKGRWLVDTMSNDPWTNQCDCVLEGTVYRVFEYMECISGITYVRKATKADIKKAKPLAQASAQASGR